MSKFKIIEEGRLTISDMSHIVGGYFTPCQLYDICNREIKQQMPPTGQMPNVSGGGPSNGSYSDNKNDNVHSAK